MIELRKGDILKSEADALVNSVNCVGVMGRGVALQFKNAYPDNFKAYAAACRRGEVVPGRMFLFETGRLTPPRYIINFPTKRHWRGRSRVEDIEAGLVALTDLIRAKDIRSIAIPPLGSGLGGLDWADIRPRIQATLASLPRVRAILFEPDSLSSHKNRSRKAPPMTPGRAALVGLMDRYLAGLLDPFVTLLEVHKLMYFLQEAGEPLRLCFTKAPYGPYAENLRHVLQEIEGHLIAGYADSGDAPHKQLSLVPGANEEATHFLARHAETRARFDRVATLVDGFESPLGLELLASVHWVATRGRRGSLGSIVRQVHAWSPRKRQFTPRQIGIAFDTLTRHVWVPEAEATSER
ncbi:MAG: type II toxin-antitoxin system antitoxin DNA ADP-ribosyl glycohydrolase DarG [Terriglobales bacterium]